MKIFHVTVHPDNRWNMVTVDGRHFSKTTVAEIQEGDLTDEIRNSPLLQVTEAEGEAEARPKRGRKGAKDDTDS
jgi:hypothetical protein